MALRVAKAVPFLQSALKKLVSQRFGEIKPFRRTIGRFHINTAMKPIFFMNLRADSKALLTQRLPGLMLTSSKAL
ncbi:hypothetical protein [Nitratireductor sp. PBL-C9]|uniref:hypothetical protein n=1 Tax=Nitratireductor sp. PBL-C9 TaxID=3435013 RepID=UPI003D7EE593